MTKLSRIATLAVVASFAIAPAGIAAKAKPKAAPKKPATRTSTKPSTTIPHTVQGTTQLKGEYAELGTTYTLGKSYPMNITLKSAEYTVEPVQIGNQVYTANAEQKLLVLHMSYHNPQSTECFVRWDSFGFTVVDPKDQNHDGLRDLGAEKDKASLSMSFKPAQKSDVFGVMVVPAAAEMPKLIIKSSDETVLRYDLRGKVKGLPAPYADPADKTGATALSTITALPDTYYPVGVFNFKFNKAEFSSAKTMADYELDEGERFFIVQFTLKNISPDNQFFRWDSFNNKIIDSDDVEINSSFDVFQASKNKPFSSELKPGQELTLRYGYKVPADTEVKKLTISQEDGRTFEFDLSGAN